MPTFVIFRSGSAMQTIVGASPQLTSSIENAVKLAGPSAGAVYSSAGRTLGSGPIQGSSISRRYNVQTFIDALIAFFGLYFTTLFTLDAYQAGENSPFNIHKPRQQAQPTAKGAQARAPGGASQSGRKLGTIADLSGGN
jgi:thioredoxin 1